MIGTNREQKWYLEPTNNSGTFWYVASNVCCKPIIPVRFSPMVQSNFNIRAKETSDPLQDPDSQGNLIILAYRNDSDSSQAWYFIKVPTLLNYP
jgi:hypothetical protein